MAKGYEVLTLLIPTGGWVITGDDFDSIIYDDGVTPLTKKQFNDAFPLVDAQNTQKETERATARTALLSKLGITEDEAKLLLS